MISFLTTTFDERTHCRSFVLNRKNNPHTKKKQTKGCRPRQAVWLLGLSVETVSLDDSLDISCLVSEHMSRAVQEFPRYTNNCFIRSHSQF